MQDNSIEFWRKFVAEFFAPNAKKRWCVSLYGNSRQTNGVFPQVLCLKKLIDLHFTVHRERKSWCFRKREGWWLVCCILGALPSRILNFLNDALEDLCLLMFDEGAKCQ